MTDLGQRREGVMNLRLKEIAERTRLSLRYWQRQAAAGVIPGTQSKKCGKRRIYFVDADQFAAWWSTQLKEVKPCAETPAISVSAAKRGGGGSKGTTKNTRGRAIQETLASLKSAETANSPN